MVEDSGIICRAEATKKNPVMSYYLSRMVHFELEFTSYE